MHAVPRLEPVVAAWHNDPAVAGDVEDQKSAQAAELAQRYAGRTRGELKRLGQETEYYAPSVPRAGLALLLLAGGFAVTLMIGRMGKKEDASGSA